MNKNDLKYLDTLRFIAICGVILIHVVSGITDTQPQLMSITQYRTYTFFKCLGAFGVPVFLMISGTLFLSPQKKITIQTLLCKYIRRIVVALLLFGTFFASLELFFTSHIFNVSLLFQSFVNTLKGNSWGHMWYLYALLGLYFLLPLLKSFTEIANKTTYEYVLLLLFIFGCILPLLDKYFSFKLGIMFPVQGIFLFYYLLGYYLDKYIDFSANINWILAGLLIDIFLIYIFCFTAKHHSISDHSPLVVMLSIFLFLFMKDAKRHREIYTKLRPYYFGIYLVHTFFLNLSYKLFHITPLAFDGYCLIPVFFSATFIFSLVLVWILLKIPPLKKYVL
ncbi:MAG: acyltransferase [Lachnospiraceae bacterium]|nr:acyltransferase [Lachnospiraceae bacterium]